MTPVQAVGIDLGTTYSVVAIVGEDGQAQAIPNAEGLLTTPSVALWDGTKFLVGQPALDLVQVASGVERESRSEALIRGVKRMLGNPPKSGLVSNGSRNNADMAHSRRWSRTGSARDVPRPMRGQCWP